MKNSKVLKGFLIISGLLLVFVGASILFTPVAFTAKNGIELGGNISLLNDIKSTGGLFLVSGLMVMLGTIKSRLAYTSTVISIVTFLAVGVGRTISIILDGMPAEGLIKATVAEFVFGLVGVFMLVKYQEK